MAREPKKTLTDRLIKSIKPGPRVRGKQVMDALVPGFGIRVTDKERQDLHLSGPVPRLGVSGPARDQQAKPTLEKARDTAREMGGPDQAGDATRRRSRRRQRRRRRAAAPTPSVPSPEVYFTDEAGDVAVRPDHRETVPQAPRADLQGHADCRDHRSGHPRQGHQPDQGQDEVDGPATRSTISVRVL